VGNVELCGTTNPEVGGARSSKGIKLLHVIFILISSGQKDLLIDWWCVFGSNGNRKKEV
jgi:hypothetical protein